jgi:hypothetical protein
MMTDAPRYLKQPTQEFPRGRMKHKLLSDGGKMLLKDCDNLSISQKQMVQKNIDYFKMLIEEKQFHSDIARCYFRLELGYDINVIDFIEYNYKQQNDSWKDFYLKMDDLQ